MKKIGIVGGVSWRSTVDYYCELCRRSEERNRALNLPDAPLTPEIAIESLDHNRAVALLGHDDDDDTWLSFDAYHRDALERLKASGAEVALIASNTPHHRFEPITRGIGIPVLSIFAAAAQAAERMRARRVLILGTRSTMSSPGLRQAFAEYGIEAADPGDEPRRALTVALIEELQQGLVAGTAERLAAMVRSAIERRFQNRAVACLACTELPLAFPEFRTVTTFEFGGVSWINSTAAHIDAVYEFAVACSD
jgi:aspartate racemase